MMSIVKKTGFSIFNEIGVTKICRAQKKNKITILNLHRISPERDFFFNPITPRHFELLLKYVSKHYSVLTIADVNNLPVSQRESNKPYLVLSFDDGYYDFIEYALPLLIKYKLPSNHNIVNSCANNNEIIWTHRLNNIFNHCREKGINLQWNFEDEMPLSVSEKTKNLMQLYSHVFKILLNTPYQKRIQWISEKENELSVSVSCTMMNWNQVIECTKHRVEIGSHTLNHDALATITDPGCLQDAIQQSKIEIEKNIKKPVDILALPNGQTNKDIVMACTNAGITNILFVDDKVNSWSNFGTNEVNLISRINISDEAPGEMFLRTELFHSRIRRYVKF